MSVAARVVIEATADGKFRVGSQGLDPAVVETMLLRALAGIQRELLARRVVQLQREGIVVAHAIPGDGGHVR